MIGSISGSAGADASGAAARRDAGPARPSSSGRDDAYEWRHDIARVNNARGEIGLAEDILCSLTTKLPGFPERRWLQVNHVRRGQLPEIRQQSALVERVDEQGQLRWRARSEGAQPRASIVEAIFDALGEADVAQAIGLLPNRGPAQPDDLRNVLRMTLVTHEGEVAEMLDRLRKGEPVGSERFDPPFDQYDDGVDTAEDAEAGARCIPGLELAPDSSDGYMRALMAESWWQARRAARVSEAEAAAYSFAFSTLTRALAGLAHLFGTERTTSSLSKWCVSNRELCKDIYVLGAQPPS